MSTSFMPSPFNTYWHMDTTKIHPASRQSRTECVILFKKKLRSFLTEGFFEYCKHIVYGIDIRLVICCD